MIAEARPTGAPKAGSEERVDVSGAPGLPLSSVESHPLSQQWEVGGGASILRRGK